MRIAEIRNPAELPQRPASRQSFFLTGGAPVSAVPLPWLADQQAILQDEEVLFQQPYRSIYFPLKAGISGIQPFFISSTAAVYLPTFLSGGTNGQPADAQLFINGVSVEWETNPGDPQSAGMLSGSGSAASLESSTITKYLGQNGTFTFTFMSTAGVLPQAYDDVVFYRYGLRKFGGYVTAVSDVLIVSTTLREYGVACVDYNGLFDRVVVAKYYTIPMSGIISIVLLDFASTYLAQFGVTYQYFEFGDPDVEIGPILFHYILMSAAIAQLLQQASGWYVIIDAYKHMSLRNQASGLPAAPYSIADPPGQAVGNGLGAGNFSAMSNTQDNSQYRNRQWVLPSVATASLWTDTFTGDGVTTAFLTQYNPTSQPVVYLNGVLQTVTLLGTWDVPFQWYWITGGQGIFQNPSDAPIALGATLTVSYPSPFTLAAMAENTAEIGIHGLVENIYSPTDVISQVEAQNLAEGLLAAYCPGIPSVIEFTTNESIEKIAGGWLEPGDIIPVNTTAPLALGAYLVQQITSTENDLTIWTHDIVARLQNGATDYQTTLAKLLQAALSNPNPITTETAVFQVAPTLAGTVGGVPIVNPGVAGGPVPSVYIFAKSGILASWSAVFQTAPSGSATIIDIDLNGSSCLPPGAQKIIIEPGPANNGVVVTGFQFSGNPVAYNAGDVLSLYVLSPGGGSAKDGTVTVVGFSST